MNVNERLKQEFSDWCESPLPAWTRRSARALPRVAVHVERTAPSRWFVAGLIARPLMVFAAFVCAALAGWWLVAVPLVGLVYGSALTCVHHLIHGGLGLSPRARHFWLRWVGVLVVESGHALQVTHLAHHRGDHDVPDPEGFIENVSWRQMPLAALAFRYRLMFIGLRMAPTARRRSILIEIATHALLHVGSLALLPVTWVPWVYLTMIHVSSYAFAVLAGKGPQTNYGRPIATPFVRVQTKLGRLLFFSHDQHLEHHAAPKIPLPHLKRYRSHFAAEFGRHDVLDVRMPL